MTREGVNIGRGAYRKAYAAADMVYETRCLIAELFHGEDPRQVVFTKNVTESLNLVLKGYLKPGDHVLTSSVEHNAVMRPLKQIGVAFTRVPCTETGELKTEELERSLRPETKAVVMTHASNVCGTILPFEAVGRFCSTHGLKFFADCAQTAGSVPVDMEAMNIDALCFTGHKGLLGPQGIGGVVLRKGLEQEIAPLVSGSTQDPWDLPRRRDPFFLRMVKHRGRGRRSAPGTGEDLPRRLYPGEPRDKVGKQIFRSTENQEIQEKNRYGEKSISHRRQQRDRKGDRSRTGKGGL